MSTLDMLNWDKLRWKKLRMTGNRLECNESYGLDWKYSDWKTFKLDLDWKIVRLENFWTGNIKTGTH